MTPFTKNEMKKKTVIRLTQYKEKANGWVLYHGEYEIKWKNGKADEICIANTILKIKPWKPRPAKKLMA